MSPVKEASPDATKLDEAFAAAMGAAPKPREPSAPPEVDHDAPHGRDADGKALAPFGYTKDGRVRKSKAGRPLDSERARTSPAPPPAAKGKDETSAPAKVDYTEGLAAFADSAWLATTMAGRVPWSRIPLVGRIKTKGGIPLGERLKGAEVRFHAQAHIFNANRAELVTALNIAADHNARARRLAEKLSTDGDITWVITVIALVSPFAHQVGTLWSGQFDGSAEDQPAEKLLAAANENTFAAWKERINRQMEAAAAAELAAASSSSGTEVSG